MTTPKVLLKRSSVVGRVPQSGDLDYGELAINFADGKIYYKNSSNQIVAFIDSARTQALIDAVNQTAEDQLDSAEVISLIDSAYIQLKQSYNATLLEGESADYYRNYDNLFNKPLILDMVDVQNIIDARVNQTFVDNLNVDADTLDGLNSTQFLRSDSDTRLTADLTIDSNLTVGGDAVFNSDVTLSGNLYGPATMFIDPAVHDSDTGKVVIRGDLQVDGTQTIVNSTTVSINDKNIILADSAADSAEADGAGITVNGANATITYNAAEDEWQFNKKIQSPNLEVTNVIDATTVNTTNITSTNINTTNITGNYTNFDSDFDSALGTKTTTDLTEGSNLYYTTTRHDSDFDVRFALKTTDDLTEGNTNLYYTTARQDSDTRVLVDSAYIKSKADSSYITNIIDNASNVFVNNVDSAYVQQRQLKTFGLAGNTGTHTFNTETETLTFLGTTGQINAGIAANNVTLELDQNINSITSIAFEGTSSNNNETKIQAVNPTKDNTINLPDSSGTIALLTDVVNTIRDSAFITNIIDSAYIKGVSDSSYITNIIDNATTVNISTFVNDANYLDSTTVQGVIDNTYIETNRPAETIFNVTSPGLYYRFSGDGFSSNRDNPTLYLTRGKTYKFNVSVSGHPFQIRTSNGGSAYNTGVTNNGAQSGAILFTPDMNAPTSLVYQCTIHGSMVGDIIIIDESSYLDSAEAIALIDSAYVRNRVRTNQDLRTTDSVTFAGIRSNANSFTFGESDATMTYLPDSDAIIFNKPLKGEDVNITGLKVQSDSGTFNGLYVYDDRPGKDWVARFSRRRNEFNSPAVVLISTDAEARSDMAFEIRGNANSNNLGPEFDDGFHDDDNTTFAVYGSGHTLIGYSNLPPYSGGFAQYPYSMLSGDNNVRLQVAHGISVDSNIVIHDGNKETYIDSDYVQARQSTTTPTITIQDSGVALTTAASTLNFVGPGVVASGTGATKTITITGGGGGAGSGLDSALISQLVDSLVDSAFIQGKTTAGTDSAATIALINSTIDSIGAISNVNSVGATHNQILKFDSSIQKFVLASDATGGGGGGSGTLDSSNISGTIDSAYVKARVDHNGNEVLIFGDNQAQSGSLSASNTTVHTHGAGQHPPDNQFSSTYLYSSGGMPIGQWVYAYYSFGNSAVGYGQISNKVDNGNGSYTYYTAGGNLQWAAGWSNIVVLASIVGAKDKGLRISHQTVGDYLLFDGRRNFVFSQNDSDQRNFKIDLSGTSALEMVGGKHIHYGNSYDSDGAFPSGTTFKGMVAHAKNNDAMYYANDSGIWTPIAGTGAQAFGDSAEVALIIDSDYILDKKFVPGDAERRWNITSAAPTGPQQVSTGDFWLDRDDLILYRLTADGNWSSSLPAGTFSAEAGLTSNNVFQNNAGVASTSFNIGASHTPPGPSGTFSSTFRVSTSPFNSGGRWTFTNPVNFGYFYFGNSDAGHLWAIGYTDGSYMVSNSGIAGSKTVTPSSYTWYDAAGNSLGKTINQGNSGAHTHDVRHPNGVLASYIIFGRNNYGTRDYDAWAFFSGANDWVRVGEIYDSSEIRALSPGTDSATVQTLAQAVVDSSAVPFTQTFFHFTADSGQKTFSGLDDDSETLSYTAGALAVYLNGVLLIDSADYTSTSGTSIVLTDSANLGDVLTVQKMSGNSLGGNLDSAKAQGIIDSNFLNAGSNFIPTLDSTYDLGSSTKKWKDLYLSGNSIYLGGHQIRKSGNNIRFTDSSGNSLGLLANNILDSSNVVSIIGSETLDSALIVNLVDSAYIQLRDRFQDSAGITAVVDSAYVRQRVTQSDLDMSGNKVLFANVYDSIGSLPSATTYHGMFAHVHNTGAGYFAHAGNWVRLANQSELGGGTVDSADIIAIVDSAYVQARQTSGGGGGGGGIDSAATLALIDSDYVRTRVDFARGEVGTERSQYTATASQTVFNHTSIDPTHLDVYLNGVLQVVGTDYNATTTAVTFTTGITAGHSVTIVERRGRVLTQRALVEAKYYFTTPTPTTSITGSDDNGVTLDYSTGGLDVFLNGILLKDSDDYSTNAGTTVTLVSATDSNDIVTLVNRKGAVVSPNVKNYEFTATASQTTFSGTDINGETLAYSAGAVQVYLNGILLRNVDYTATNGSSIVLATGAAVNDELVVSAFSNPGQNLDLYKYTADSGQTIFNGASLDGSILAYNPGNIQVFMNGLLLNDSDDYTANNGMSVVLTNGADSSDEIKIATFVSNSTTLRTNAWTAPADSSISAAAGDKIIVDTSAAKTITLPSSATLGDEIRIIDGTGNAATNNITVARNGHKIIGADSDLTININRAGLGLVYYNTTQGWLLIEN